MMSDIACANCGKSAENAESKLLRCSVCASASYCSTDCQKAAWPNHKKECTQTGTQALIRAVRDGYAARVQRLSKTARVVNGQVDFLDETHDDSKTLGQWSALHQSVQSTRPEMMQILLNNKAKPDIKDVDGEPPLFIAGNAGKHELVEMLLGAGANPDFQAHDAWTPLMMATRKGSVESVRAFLDAGADVYLGRDMFGRTARDIAQFQASGQGGFRIADGQPIEEARARHMANGQAIAQLLEPYH